MGKAVIDHIRTTDDIEKLKALHAKVCPDAPMPPFGENNQETLILRDADDRTRIVGLIHLEQSVEIRAMMTDPDYEHRLPALTIAYNVAEGLLRTRGTSHYYVTIPREHKHVLRFYEEDGATRVDGKAVRFRKEL